MGYILGFEIFVNAISETDIEMAVTSSTHLSFHRPFHHLPLLPLGSGFEGIIIRFYLVWPMKAGVLTIMFCRLVKIGWKGRLIVVYRQIYKFI